MSLATATKEISEHPSKSAVTAPTDPKAQQADVEGKLRLYGVVQAFREGRMPTNAQIDETLSYVRDHPPIDIKKLSPEGKKLTDDFREIIETARQMIVTKNSDEIFQDFVYNTSDASVKPETANAPVGKDELKKHRSEASQHLRTLLQLLLTNSETRKLLSDFTLIGRDLFAQGAATVAERSRPGADKMATVDDAAPSGQWDHDQALNGDAKSAGHGLLKHLKDTHKDLAEPSDAAKRAAGDPTVPTASPDHDPAAPFKTEAPGLTDVVRDTTHTADQRHPQAIDVVTDTVDKNTSSDGANKSLKARFQALTSKKVPQEHRERATAELQGVKNNLKDQFPKERRDQFVYRLKKCIVECQSHPSYKASLEWFLNIVEQYFDHAKAMAKDQKGHSARLFENDPALQQATDQLRTLAERFANNKSLDEVIASVQRLWDDAREDEELRNWWARVDKYVRKALLEPGYILQPQCNNEARALREDGRRFFDDKYKNHKDTFFQAVGDWFSAFGDDPQNKAFGQAWSGLTKDLLLDDSGSLTYKSHLWNDVRTVIMPELARQVAYIPIPRIEYSDKALDLVIENLTLQGRNLFPNIFEVQASTHFKMSPYQSIKDESHHQLSFTMSQIQADLRDCAFYYNKKTGFPKLRDTGLVDVFLGGEGITVKVKLVSATDDKRHVFIVKDVNVKVDSLKIVIKDAKHSILYKFIGLAKGLIRKQIAKAISDGVRTGLELVDEQLVQVRSRMAEVNETDSTSRMESLKQMFTQKSDEAESKVSSTKAKRESKFKIVPRRDSMLLPEQGHETGWSRLQHEKEQQATEGEGWRSNAFSIVPGSTSHPAATAPTATPVPAHV